ncbi:hypothetical protein T4D_3038 [Trichinella pseudospiralis]|uniref:Uncharacterized protein n=1 Tax=Trichinella pseudospiralis TaxID=6337 RepID=A0A0V1FJF7_TRIPS|nr:hypothetical protein T4D_3038 [Trichinella pseudospiralis]
MFSVLQVSYGFVLENKTKRSPKYYLKQRVQNGGFLLVAVCYQERESTYTLTKQQNCGVSRAVSFKITAELEVA